MWQRGHWPWLKFCAFGGTCLQLWSMTYVAGRSLTLVTVLCFWRHVPVILSNKFSCGC